MQTVDAVIKALASGEDCIAQNPGGPTLRGEFEQSLSKLADLEECLTELDMSRQHFEVLDVYINDKRGIEGHFFLTADEFDNIGTVHLDTLVMMREKMAKAQKLCVGALQGLYSVKKHFTPATNETSPPTIA